MCIFSILSHKNQCKKRSEDHGSISVWNQRLSWSQRRITVRTRNTVLFWQVLISFADVSHVCKQPVRTAEFIGAACRNGIILERAGADFITMNLLHINPGGLIFLKLAARKPFFGFSARYDPTREIGLLKFLTHYRTGFRIGKDGSGPFKHLIAEEIEPILYPR